MNFHWDSLDFCLRSPYTWGMNSEMTQIHRRYTTAPTRWLLEHVDFVGKTVLHHGEGKAFPDTRALAKAGALVRPYEPASSDLSYTAHWPALQRFDVAVSNYVFNTLNPYWRELAFNELMKVCQSALIAVRTDRVPGDPCQDGVLTQRQTFQTQLNRHQWVEWFTDVSPEGCTVNLLHNGGHFCIIEVSR